MGVEGAVFHGGDVADGVEVEVVGMEGGEEVGLRRRGGLEVAVVEELAAAPDVTEALVVVEAYKGEGRGRA